MVKAVGNTPAVIAQLATLHDKDHALLRKRHAQNGTSLDFFNRRSNAKRRQQSLAAQGIVSELFEHKLRQPAQPLVAKLD
jgi:cell division inhibitor SulA